jgi:hypothetical protein
MCKRARIVALPTSIALRHLICCIEAEAPEARPSLAQIGRHDAEAA